MALLILAIFARRWRRTSEPITSAPSDGLRDALLIKRWPPLISGAIVGVIGTVAYLRIEPLGVTRQLSTSARTMLTENGYLPETLDGLDVMKGCVAVISSAITNNGWLIIGVVFASLAAALVGNRFSKAIRTRFRYIQPVLLIVSGALLIQRGLQLDLSLFNSAVPPASLDCH